MIVSNKKTVSIKHQNSKKLDERQKNLVKYLEESAATHKIGLSEFAGGTDKKGDMVAITWMTNLEPAPKVQKGRFELTDNWRWSIALVMDAAHRRKLSAFLGIKCGSTGIPIMSYPASEYNSSKMDEQSVANEFLIRVKATLGVAQDRITDLNFLMNHGDVWSAMADWCRLDSRGERDEKFPWPKLCTVDKMLNEVCGRDAIRPIDVLCIGHAALGSDTSPVRQLDTMFKLVNILHRKSPN